MDARPQGEEWVGREVKLWVGLTMNGYPPKGTVTRWLPDYPGGPECEVTFPPNDFVPLACLKPEWLFPVASEPQR